MAEKVEAKMKETRCDHLVFAIMDNSVYSAMAPTGDNILSRRDNKGNYHIDGELVICSKSAMHVLFNSVKPLLEKARGVGAVLMAPLPQYLTNGCCRDKGHMLDRRSPDFQARLMSELREVAVNLKNTLFTGGFRNIKLLDPAAVLKDVNQMQVWGDDPIHPLDEAYERLAKQAFKLCLVSGDSSARKRPRRKSDSSTEADLRGPSSQNRGECGDSRGRGDGRGSHGGHGGGCPPPLGVIRGFRFGAVDVRTLDSSGSGSGSS
jgi:hypothetical protein